MARKRTSVAASKVRQQFSEVVTRAAFRRERIVMHRHGKPLAVVVSVDDLRALEDCEAADRGSKTKKRRPR